MLTIRKETPADHAAVAQITAAAFAGSEHGHNGEAELVDALRNHCEEFLALVACQGDEVLGHILFTPAFIRTARQPVHGMGLAPLSVAPQHQRCGVGSLLITAGIQRVFDSGSRFVMVLGEPAFYQRSGFAPAADWRVSHGFEGPGQHFFQLQTPPGGVIPPEGGKAYYHPQFGAQHNA